MQRLVPSPQCWCLQGAPHTVHAGWNPSKTPLPCQSEQQCDGIQQPLVLLSHESWETPLLTAEGNITFMFVSYVMPNTNNNTVYKNIVKYLLTLLNTGKIKQYNY